MSTPAATVSPTLTTAYTAIVAFILSVTGLASTQVIRGVQNRASMPLPGFITVQFLQQRRLRTNIHQTGSANPPTTATLEEDVELTFQIDCYGPQSNAWATMLSTLLRDEYGVNQLSPSGVTPLYADEARFIPFIDGESQWEERWSLDARFQLQPVTTIPQQYADVLDLTLVNVTERFPPA
jgi:hypothetical protein